MGQVSWFPALRAEILVGQGFGTPALNWVNLTFFDVTDTDTRGQRGQPFLVDFAQIWQNSSDFFDFLLLFDFQTSESKRFLMNLPRSPPFHQNLAPKLPVSDRIRPQTTRK